MATVNTSFTSLAEIGTSYATIESATLTLESSLISLDSAFTNIDTYEFMSVDVLSATRIAGTLTNGDYIDVRGTRLNAFPITITAIDYTFAANGLTIQMEGSITQTSELSDPTGTISRVVLASGESRISFVGAIDIAAQGDALIDELEIQVGTTTLTATGSIVVTSSLGAGGVPEVAVSGTVSALTLNSATGSLTITGLTVDPALLLDAPTTNFEEFLRGILNGSDDVIGTGGAEYLFGYGGADSLTGFGGNDTLAGGAGNDTMLGGSGNDIYIVDSVGDRVFETTTQNSSTDAGGIDTVRASVAFTLGKYVEHLTLTGTNAIDGTGNGLANRLVGNSAANVLFGAKGNDTLMGKGGNDRLNGGSGADTMLGGAGNDTYIVDSAGDRVFETTTKGGSTNAGGVDDVKSSVTFTLGNFIEHLTLTGTNALDGTGNGLANRLTGNGANNALSGAAGDDMLVGNAGNDKLVGASGADTLRGGDGSDTLIGGNGRDVMTGGAGNDVFDFNALNQSGPTVATRDVITDFARGHDKIDLSTLDANSALAGNQAFTQFIAATATFTQAGQLKFDGSVLYANVDSDADAEFAISLTGVSNLTMTDLIA